MDIQISLDAHSNIQVHQGQEELSMELSMGLEVECLERNSQQVYLIELVNGKMRAKPASESVS